MKSTDGKRVIQASLLVAVLGLLAAVVVISSVSNAGGDLKRFREVKQEFEQGRYTYSAPGVVLLSSSDRRLTVDGFVYVTGDPPSLMLFERWRGQGRGLVATAWSRSVLRPGETVEALLPQPVDTRATNASSSVPPTVMFTLRVVSDLGDQWYVLENSGR